VRCILKHYENSDYHHCGLQVNQYDSEAMAEILKDDGYDIVPYSADHPADVYIINTCSVTNTSDGKSRQMIRRAASVNSDAVIVVAGCYSQVSTKDIINIEGVDIVLGTRSGIGLLSI